MTFDDLYKSLDDVADKKIKTDVCCDDSSNYISDNGTIICKVCNNSINNIIDSPEWRYYGSDDSKTRNPTRNLYRKAARRKTLTTSQLTRPDKIHRN